MKRFLMLLVIILGVNFVFLSPAWASYTEYVKQGEWIYDDDVDDFSYVYCDLGLIDGPERRYSSLTEVTITVQCTGASTSTSYDRNLWTLDIRAAGRYESYSGGTPTATHITSVSGAGPYEKITKTIAIPNAGYNGLGFYHRGYYDEEQYKITVTKIKYRVYKVDGFSLSISGENRDVKLSVNYTPVSNFRFVVSRSPSRSRNLTFSGSSSTDSEVETEKYYTYTLYSGFRITETGGGDTITRSIRVPSDATEVKEVIDDIKLAADNAKTSADIAAARSYYSGNTSGYWSYNAYSKANSANTNASNAKTSADAAKNAANNAKTSADSAAANTIYNGKSAAQWAAEAATAAALSGSSSAIYTVTANKPYMLIIEGEYGSNAGTLCNATDVKTGKTGTNAVLATSPTGSGVTIVETNPDYNNGDGFTSPGIKKVIIGSKTIYINTVAPPTAGTVTVTF